MTTLQTGQARPESETPSLPEAVKAYLEALDADAIGTAEDDALAALRLAYAQVIP